MAQRWDIAPAQTDVPWRLGAYAASGEPCGFYNGKLAALYNFAYRKLIEASTHRDPAALDEALDVLRYQRQTWAMLLDQLGKQKAGNAARNLDLPAPSARMETTISMKA